MILPARKNGGFSLIELAIITTIIGLLLSAGLQTYRTYMVVKVKNDTEVHRGLVEEALARHLFNFLFLPCPAGPALAPSDTTIFPMPAPGKANCAASTAVGACEAISGVCIADTTSAASGRHSSCNPGAVTVKDRVIIGSVPYIDLGLSVQDSLDGWGNRLTYAISQYLTSAASYSESCGAITVQKWDTATATPSNGFFNGVASAYLFVLLSHGSTGAGAFSYYGQRKACSAGTRDNENCDNDATFLLPGGSNLDTVFSTAPGATFYDDAFVSFDITRDKDKWSRTGGSMVAKGLGRVGIGGPPNSSYYLDVQGNIKLDDFQVDSICTNTGVCFPQNMIGGSGITCNGGLATGIANGTVICVPAQINTAGLTPANCPAGQLLKGFTAGGGIICLAP
jgi:hypothetical protein